MWYRWEDDPTSCGRFCHECGYFQVWANFHNQFNGRNGFASNCKKCKGTGLEKEKYGNLVNCSNCGGLPKKECDFCGGSGKLADDK